MLLRPLIALGCICLTACVLPESFSRDLDADLERQQQAAQRAAYTPEVPPVLHSERPFIDPQPRQMPPPWTQLPVGDFRSAALGGAQLLRLVAAAAGVRAIVELTADFEVNSFHFAGGTARALMRAVADQLGLFWRAEEETVIFADRQVRVFDLASFADFTAPDTDGLSDTDAAQKQPEGGDTQQPNLRPWQQLEQRVQLLAGEDAQVLLSPEQGVLTVRARPVGMAAAEEYLAQWNRHIGRQVELDVKLVQVALSNESDIGLDWSAVKNSMGGDFEVSATAPGGQSRGLLIGGEARGDEVITALFSAFASQGRVRVLTNPRGVALNGRATDIALVTQTAYLARTLPGLANTAGGGGEAGLEPGVVESGFVLRIVPKIRGQQIVLRLNARISTLKELSQVSSGSQSIQVPTLTESRFSHWARVASGDTLVLGGVRELHSRQDVRSSPHRTSRREQSEQVLLITPRII